MWVYVLTLNSVRYCEFSLKWFDGVLKKTWSFVVFEIRLNECPVLKEVKNMNINIESDGCIGGSGCTKDLDTRIYIRVAMEAIASIYPIKCMYVYTFASFISPGMIRTYISLELSNPRISYIENPSIFRFHCNGRIFSISFKPSIFSFVNSFVLLLNINVQIKYESHWKLI